VLLDKEKYCSKHQPEKRVPFKNAVRHNEGLYNTTKWRKLRNITLTEQPLCSICGISNKEASLQVHHIVAPRGNEELFFDENNLTSVCSTCHRKITAKEIRC